MISGPADKNSKRKFNNYPCMSFEIMLVYKMHYFGAVCLSS